METLLALGRTLASFAVSLGILIFVHEFGHFLVAKLAGVGVERFSLGFGPRLFGFRRGETDYRVSVLPLGGYVKMLGESTPEEVPAAQVHLSFVHKPLWRRALIVAAGPLSNLLLAVVLYILIFALFGLTRITPDIGTVTAGSPAAQAGIKAGDRIIAIDGVKIRDWEQLSDTIRRSSGKPLNITLKRGGESFTVQVVPQMRTTRNLFGEEISRPLIGIVAANKMETVPVSPVAAVGYGCLQTWHMIKLTFVVVAKLIQGVVSPRTLAGPLGIAQMSGQVAQAGAVAFLSFIALLSVNLGILNLLPIPILDGGHLVFYAIEAIRGRPLSLRKQELAQQVGLFLIIALMAFAFYNDIYRLFFPGKGMP